MTSMVFAAWIGCCCGVCWSVTEFYFSHDLDRKEFCCVVVVFAAIFYHLEALNCCFEICHFLHCMERLKARDAHVDFICAALVNLFPHILPIHGPPMHLAAGFLTSSFSWQVLAPTKSIIQLTIHGIQRFVRYTFTLWFLALLFTASSCAHTTIQRFTGTLSAAARIGRTRDGNLIGSLFPVSLL